MSLESRPGLEEFRKFVLVARKLKTGDFAPKFLRPRVFLSWICGKPWTTPYTFRAEHANSSKNLSKKNKAELAEIQAMEEQVTNLFRGRSIKILHHDFFKQSDAKNIVPGLERLGPIGVQDAITHLREDVLKNAKETKTPFGDATIIESFHINTTANHPLLFTTEHDMAREFANWMESQKTILGAIECRPYDGFEMLPFGLAQSDHPSFSSDISYQKILYVAPQIQLGKPQYGPTLKAILNHLGVQNWDAALNSLAGSKTLLLLSGFDAFKQQKECAGTKAFVEALENRMQQSEPIRVVLMITKLCDQTMAIKGLLEDHTPHTPAPPKVDSVDRIDHYSLEALTREPSEAMEKFHQLLSLYENCHDKTPKDPTDFRIRQAEWAFSTGAQSPDQSHSNNLRPCDIRIRAFLSANRDLYGLDNTLGFTALSGLSQDQWSIEIRLYHRSIVVWLSNQTAVQLHMLRLLSIALLWMRATSLDALCSFSVMLPKTDDTPNQTDRKILPKHRKAARENAVSDLIDMGVVKKRRQSQDHNDIDSNEGILYLLPLGLRAIVCEAWKKSNPNTRSIAHMAFAEVLHQKEVNREDLLMELPLQTLSGRGREFFECEILRHLVRATEFKDLPVCHYTYQEALTDNRSWPLNVRGYDDPQKFKFRWLQPGMGQQAIRRVAEQQVFNSLIGAYKGSKDVLSNRHTLGNLHAEALALLLSLRRSGTPPLETPKLSLRQAQVAVNLGAIKHAQSCFEQFLKEAEREENDEDQTRALLGLATLARETDQLEKAESLVSQACHVAALSKNDDLQLRCETGVAANEISNQDPSSAIKRIHGAIQRYQLPKSFTPDRPDEANDLKRAVAYHANGSTGFHLIEAYVAAVKKEGGKLTKAALQNIQMAEIICLENGGFVIGTGAQNMPLAFCIQYAGILRLAQADLVSESLMESIRRYILKNSVSAVQHLTFMDAAGDFLCANNKPARGTLLYHLPSFELARKLGYQARARKTAKKVLSILNTPPNDPSFSNCSAQPERVLEIMSKNLKGQDESDKAASLGESPTDWVIPQSSFSLTPKSLAIETYSDPKVQRSTITTLNNVFNII